MTNFSVFLLLIVAAGATQNSFKHHRRRGVNDEVLSHVMKRDTESTADSEQKMSLDPGAYLETLSKQGQDAMTIFRSAVNNFAEIAFPPGENTTLTEAVNNVVREVEATHKELSGWQIEQALLDSIKEKTSEFIEIAKAASTRPTERTTAMDFETRIAELSEQSTRGMSGQRAPSVLIVLGVLTTVLMFTSLLGLYFVCKQRARVRELEATLRTHENCGVHLKEQEQNLLTQP